jgi:hypothetical protein
MTHEEVLDGFHGATADPEERDELTQSLGDQFRQQFRR